MTELTADKLRSWSQYIDRRAAGKDAEVRFFAICAAAKLQGFFPPWLEDIKKASPEEDMLQGVDAWAFTTDAYEFKLNIKSSSRALKLSEEKAKKRKVWKKQRRHLIVPIIVPPRKTDGQVWRHIIHQLTCARNERLAKFAARGKDTS